MKAKVKTLDLVRKRHAGKPIDTPPRPVLSKGMLSHAPSSVSEAPTFTQIFEKWSEEHKSAGGPEKTVKDFGTYVRRFVELHGDLQITQITKAHVRAFKDAMLRLPVRPSGKLLKMTVPELVEYTDKHPDVKVLSARTVNDKGLGAIGAVLNWAVENAYIEVNPASKVKAKSTKTKKTVRQPYSVEDLNLIFNFPIYSEADRPKGGAGEAAKWLPLMAAFTGARLEELGQLTVDDIKNEQGIYYFDMTAVDDNKRRKTESSKRRVPIHSKLIELGFLDYVAEMGQAGQEAQLFPLLKSKGEKRTASWSKWWSKYARKYGAFDSSKVFHSFRHSFKDGLREGGVQEEVSDALTGHAPVTEGRKYGSNAYPLKRLKEGIEQLTYPGLELPHF